MRNVTVSEMIEMFGEEKYLKANEVFVGRKHHFAKNPKLMTDEERNALIVETVQATGDYKAAAEQFDLSTSRIYDIVNKGIVK